MGGSTDGIYIEPELGILEGEECTVSFKIKRLYGDVTSFSVLLNSNYIGSYNNLDGDFQTVSIVHTVNDYIALVRLEILFGSGSGQPD